MLSVVFLSILLIYVVFVVYSAINGYRAKRFNIIESPKILEKSVTDTIRGIAIIMIMMAHIVQQLGDRLSIPIFGGNYIKLLVFSWGGVGVGLFFLLSGFGNMASLMKSFMNPVSSKVDWILKRLIRLVISFIFSFIFVVLFTKFFGVCEYDLKDLCLHFIQLKLPDCSTWYLKIQILLYVFIFVSFFLAGLFRTGEITRHSAISGIICAVFVFGYAFIANFYMKLPDYWWKTSLCFVVGVFLYLIRDWLVRKQGKKGFKFGIIAFTLLVFSFSYIFTLRKPLSFSNLIFFSGISFALVYFFDLFNVKSNILSKVGNISLELYLIHIGLMNVIETKIFFFMKEWTTVFNVVIFVVLSFILAFITNYLNTKVLKMIPFGKRK